MRACLETRGGEVSARARAAALGHAYLALDATGRERFLTILARDFGVDGEAVDRAVVDLGRAVGIEQRHGAEQALRKTLKAARVKLLTQFNALPEGVKFLVDMRAELMELARGTPPRVLGSRPQVPARHLVRCRFPRADTNSPSIDYQQSMGKR